MIKLPFKPQPLEEFEDIFGDFENIAIDNPDTIHVLAKRDIKNLEFDGENIDISNDFSWNADKLIGYHRLDNGLCFLGVGAGGDWEQPVFHLYYFDGEHVRAYIPVRGNVFNGDVLAAYGNYPVSDNEYYAKLEKGEVNFDEIQAKLLDPKLKIEKPDSWSQLEADPGDVDPDLEQELILQEINEVFYPR